MLYSDPRRLMSNNRTLREANRTSVENILVTPGFNKYGYRVTAKKLKRWLREKH